MGTTLGRSDYPSDVSDRQWQAIEPYVSSEKERGRRRSTPVREIVNGINYRWSTGCVWRMLPHDFPPWGTVYSYFRRWQQDGILSQVRDVLLRPHRREPSRLPDRQTPREQSARPPAPAEAATDVECAA